jgi:type II secretory pathway predicted ATPase ExeA
MYNAYFCYSESPFENNMDQRFLFLCEDHEEILAALLYFVKEKKGLALVCGDVGTGKTLLINSFLARLPDSVQPILIASPLVTYSELLGFIAGALGIRDKQENILELIEQIKGVLLAARGEGKTFVLIVDEAHLLSDAGLEQVRLLSNIETPEGKLLQILLVGQYELSHKLNRPDMRQLRQRIDVSRFLSPLTPKETTDYIDHRLQRVGGSFVACFEPSCGDLLYQLTEGLPRSINQLCDNALFYCMANGLKKVNRPALQKAHEALLTDALLTPDIKVKASPKHDPVSRKIGSFLTPVAACAAFLVLGIVLGQSDFWGQFKDRMSGRPPAVMQISKSKVPPLSAPKENKTDLAGLRAQDNGVPQQKPLEETQQIAQEPESIQPSPAGPDSPDRPASTINPSQPEPGEAPVKPNTGPPAGYQTTVPPPETDKEAAQPSASQEKAESPTKPSETAEVGVQPPPAASSRAVSPQPLRQVTVQEGDTLTGVAAELSPKNVELGMVAILLANPNITNTDRIFLGQKLTLPVINSADNSISIRDNLFVFYDRYDSMPSLSKALTYLNNLGVRHSVVEAEYGRGNVTYRVLIGGYENRTDLEKALTLIKAKSG